MCFFFLNIPYSRSCHKGTELTIRGFTKIIGTFIVLEEFDFDILTFPALLEIHN